MTIDNTTVALVAAIKRRGFIPAGSGLSTETILQYASDELETYIPAFLKKIREEYLVTTLDIAASGGVVAAPARAIGAALRTIGWVLPDNRVRPLSRIEPENAGGYAGQTGEPVGYMFQGNDVVLLPAPTSGTLRLAYQQRPGFLVLPTACARVTGFDDSATPFVDAIPSTFAVGVACDFVSSTPNFTARALDKALAAVSPPDSIAFFGDVEDITLSVGDYICLAGETCIPQVPTEVHALLAQAAAHAIANATGSQRLAAIKAKLDDVEEQTRMLLSPRSDGSARPVVSRSGLGRGLWGC